MVLELVKKNQFLKDLKKAQKRGKNIKKIAEVVDIIRLEKLLPPKYRNHKLSGEYSEFWECHIEPDWLLIYKVVDNYLILARTGTHSDLFK